MAERYRDAALGIERGPDIEVEALAKKSRTVER